MWEPCVSQVIRVLSLKYTWLFLTVGAKAYKIKRKTLNTFNFASVWQPLVMIRFQALLLLIAASLCANEVVQLHIFRMLLSFLLEIGT